MLFGRLTAQAADAHAGDTYYNVTCYLRLRDAARAADRRTSTSPTPPQFDPIACAQIVAFVEDSQSVVKLPALREMFRTLMEQQGQPCNVVLAHCFCHISLLFFIMLEKNCVASFSVISTKLHCCTVGDCASVKVDVLTLTVMMMMIVIWEIVVL